MNEEELQPKQNLSVDDTTSSEAVASAETALNDELAKEVLASSVGSVTVDLWLGDTVASRVGSDLRQFAETSGRPLGGFIGQRGQQQIREAPVAHNKEEGTELSRDTIWSKLQHGGPVEVVTFAARQKRVQDEVQAPPPVQQVQKRFMRRSPPTPPARPAPPPTSRLEPIVQANPATGESEQAIHVSYVATKIPGFDDEAGRPNSLKVTFNIPKTLAEKLKAAITHEPALIRTLAERQALDIGFPQSLWDNGQDFSGGKHSTVRPPYETLPPTHVLHVCDLSPGFPEPSYEVTDVPATS